MFMYIIYEENQPGQTTSSGCNVQVDRRPSLDVIHFALIFC